MKITSLILALALILSFAGCGQPEGEKEEITEQETSSVVAESEEASEETEEIVEESETEEAAEAESETVESEAPVENSEEPEEEASVEEPKIEEPELPEVEEIVPEEVEQYVPDDNYDSGVPLTPEEIKEAIGDPIVGGDGGGKSTDGAADLGYEGHW